jgi:dipeptidyl aminopeptidase/acylaminoacyl peptidase
LASNYSGSLFSEGKYEFGGADVNDVLRLIDIAKSIPNADPKRIVMMGWSRGGQMTYQALKANH